MYRKHEKCLKRKQKGIALFISMIFITIFSTLALAMFTMTASGTIAVSNLHKVNDARISAESGLEMLRYYLGQISFTSTVPDDDKFSIVANKLIYAMNVGSLHYSVYYDDNASDPHINVGYSQSPIMLSNTENKGFYARLEPGIVTITDGAGNASSANGITFRIVGISNGIDRVITGGFTYGVHESANSVFDYGVATKGPLSLQGNILLDGVNIAVESDVYIESMEYSNALEIIGNSQIAGDVSIVNPDGTVTLQGGKAGIGGETGDDAINNHVEIGVEGTQFPYPNTNYFEQYVTGITLDSSTSETTYAADGVYENIRIAANTNPHFSGNVQLNGIIFIETPNVVTFSGNVDITGIIIGDGDVTDNSGTNQINITGNVSSAAVDAKDKDTGEYLLEGEQFDAIREETGTFLMAPGFAVSMGGSFDTLNGCIAANGITFFGNAGGEIGGSVINYSNEPMTLSGNNDLFFNRAGIQNVPAGFVPVTDIVIHYQPVSYDEGIL